MFHINLLLILIQERLYSMLKGKRNVDVVKLHKSGGIVSRNAKARQKARSLRIRVNWSFDVYPFVPLFVKIPVLIPLL